MEVYRKYDKNLGDWTVIRTTLSSNERVDTYLSPTDLDRMILKDAIAAHIKKQFEVYKDGKY